MLSLLLSSPSLAVSLSLSLTATAGPKYMVVSVMFKKGGESPLFLNQLSKLLQKGVYQYNKLDPAIDFQR